MGRRKTKRRKKAKYDKKKWNELQTDFQYGEDGEVPERLCYHGQIMRPIENPETNSATCDICDSGQPIDADHYYQCHCFNVTTNYCWHHTQDIQLRAPDSMRNILNEYDVREKREIIASQTATRVTRLPISSLMVFCSVVTATNRTHYHYQRPR